METQVWWCMTGSCFVAVSSLLWSCTHLKTIPMWVSLTFEFVLLPRAAWTQWCVMQWINLETLDMQLGEWVEWQVRQVDMINYYSMQHFRAIEKVHNKCCYYDSWSVTVNVYVIAGQSEWLKMIIIKCLLFSLFLTRPYICIFWYLYFPFYVIINLQCNAWNNKLYANC